MEAAIGGHYDLLPPPSKRRRVTEETASPNSSQGEVNTRLRAVLRAEEDALREKITKVKNQVFYNKPQEEVEVGDEIQVKTKAHWREGHVEQVDGTNIVCEEFNDAWMPKESWRYDERAGDFIQANRGDELAIFPSYQVFCNLFCRCVDKWESPTKELVGAYHDHTKLVSDCVAGTIKANPRVVQFITNTADKEINALLLAGSRSYTQDQRLFIELDQRHMRDIQEQVRSAIHTDDDGLVALGDVMNAVASGLLTTEYREVMEMQIALQAYLDVAVPRFVYAIPMRLNDLILLQVVAEMANELNGLTDEKLIRLMQDSEQKMAERQRLREELACLKKEIEQVS
ncbi:Dynamin superfamily [Phytophthora cactorum]|nr:Dynamin superfamily [Phytophthora cactorum]